MSGPPIALNEGGLTPEVLIQHVAERSQDLIAMYVVGFDAEGQAHVWLTSEPAGMALAGALMNDMAIRVMRGELVFTDPRAG
jgi:hypothetical protein